MENRKETISAHTTVNAPVEKCWKLWTTAADIMQWNNPTGEWYSPRVEIDLREGGLFLFRMETKDGKMGFDHSGKYDKVKTNELIEYTVSDGRKSIIRFIPIGDLTTVSESFEPEANTPVEMQREFCQGVLDNFKRFVELH
jgi:uncharacterized protein YndB with AHSA1/START domain